MAARLPDQRGLCHVRRLPEGADHGEVQGGAGDDVCLQEDLMRPEWEGRLVFSGEFANKVCNVQCSVCGAKYVVH